MAFVAWYILASVSVGIADAATKEEVARCRAIEQRAERVVCFKALKQSAPAKAEGAVPANAEGTTKREDGARAKAGDTDQTAPTSVEPATTSAINRLSTCSRPTRCAWIAMPLPRCSWPFCLLQTQREVATPNCQTLPSDARLEILERHPGVFPFMRMIKVKVTVSYKAEFERRLHHRDGTSAEGPAHRSKRRNDFGGVLPARR